MSPELFLQELPERCKKIRVLHLADCIEVHDSLQTLLSYLQLEKLKCSLVEENFPFCNLPEKNYKLSEMHYFSIFGEDVNLAMFSFTVRKMQHLERLKLDFWDDMEYIREKMIL